MKPDSSKTAGSLGTWEEAPLEWPRSAGQMESLMAALDVRKKRLRCKRRRALSAVAAVGATALVMMGLFFLPAKAPISPEPLGLLSPRSRSVVVTAPERRELPDGSIVELRAGAEIELAFLPEARTVRLLRGEALFDVASDPSRPFVVAAGLVHFRAVGTAFSVGLRADSVEMLVTEGTVEVERLGPGGTQLESAPAGPVRVETATAPLTTVVAGNRIVVEFADIHVPVVLPASPAETSEKLSWRVPRLEFNETPLSEVVLLLDRHRGSQINLAQAELGRVEISGSLRADNIEPLLEILDITYRIQAVRSPDGKIELKRRP